MRFNQHALSHPHNQGLCLTWGVGAWFRWFFSFFGNLLPPWATPTQPCAHPHLSCPTLIHTCICDHLGWLGSWLVHLGGFEGQIMVWHLHASKWPLKHHNFSLLYYKHVPNIFICWILIIIYVMDYFCVCYFHSFCCFVHNLWVISNCENILGS